MVELRTERLLLRDATLEDAPRYCLGISDYQVARFLTPLPYPYTLGMAIDWLRQAPPASAERCMLVIELPDQGLIGSVALLDELGFWIARPHWNRGYATEAATALLSWHFQGTSRPSVVASAQHNNAASLAVQRRLGFVEARRELRFSQALQHNVQHVVTELNRADWLNHKGAA